MEEYLGTIQSFGFNFAPRGWAFCNGQLLSISAHTALFSLFGTTYGGDGRTSFALPDLRSRSVVKVGSGPGLSYISWGQRGGHELEYVSNSELPTHSHAMIDGNVNVTTTTKVYVGSNGATNESDSGSNTFAGGGASSSIYSEPPMSANHVGGVTSKSIVTGQTANVGGSMPLEIRNPYLGVYMCVAMEGIYPSRS